MFCPFLTTSGNAFMKSLPVKGPLSINIYCTLIGVERILTPITYVRAIDRCCNGYLPWYTSVMGMVLAVPDTSSMALDSSAGSLEKLATPQVIEVTVPGGNPTGDRRYSEMTGGDPEIKHCMFNLANSKTTAQEIPPPSLPWTVTTPPSEARI